MYRRKICDKNTISKEKFNMRRFLSILLASLMILTLSVVLVVPTSAAELEGDWIATRDAEGYLEKNADSYTPAAGYHYTSEGFETICPDYTDTALRQDVNTRNKVYLKSDKGVFRTSFDEKLLFIEEGDTITVRYLVKEDVTILSAFEVKK